MSNFPHSTGIASSLSTSPFAVQSNLENLINRSRTHPHPRRASDAEQDRERERARSRDHSPTNPSAPLLGATSHTPSPHPHTHSHPHALTQADQDPSSSHLSARSSRRSFATPGPRVGTIQEASYEDPLIFQDDDDIHGESALTNTTGERSGLLGQDWSSRRGSRASRRSYGATSAPLGANSGPGAGRRVKSVDGLGRAGDSRSRSKARTPPRRESQHLRAAGDKEGEYSTSGRSDGESSGAEGEGGDGASSSTRRRGRATDSRPLSRPSSPYSSTHRSTRRVSVSAQGHLGDDSSGEEGGDVVRGLMASGGGAIFGARGAVGGGAQGEGVVMDLDPVDELDAVDLELPVAEDGTEVREWRGALRAEFPIILRSSVPVFFTQAAEWSLVLASVVSIGHLGTTDLAASSLASMTASVSCFSILQGLATALDTLLPAAWTSSEPSRVGLWTQRMFVVMAVAMIPMYLLWWNIAGVLVTLGQEPKVAQRAQLYLRWLSMGIPGYGGNVLIKKYLQAQNLMHVPTYTLFLVAPLNLVLNWLLVWGPEPIRLGFAGGAVATATSYNLAFIISTAWAIMYGPPEAWHPIRFKYAFSKLGTCTSLGLAGTIMLSSEWWAWEACALAASLLGPVNLAAQSVLLSTASTFFQVPASLGIASAVRVGNLLGAGRGWEAKWASRACLFLSITFALVNSSICIIFRKNWGYLFNNDPEVVELVASIMPYIALFQIADGAAATSGSVLRSLGLHTTGALINLTSYYIIGLPFGIWLTFQPSLALGLVGLWIGLSVALMYASVVSFVMVWRANWTRAVERVRERLGLPVHGQIGADGKWDGEGEGGEEGGDAGRVGRRGSERGVEI
ncbi:hypothetical protein IAT38_002801 [Cryptococcus sp. DSM 104549]